VHIFNARTPGALVITRIVAHFLLCLIAPSFSLGIFDSSSENRVFSSLEQRLVTWIALEFFAWCTSVG